MLDMVCAAREELCSPEGGIEVNEIFEAKEKLKWLKRFAKAYSTHLNPNIIRFYENSRFFVAAVGGREVGFIRIMENTQEFKAACDYEVWCASEAYVKEAYRSKGILWTMINHVIQRHHVKMALISEQRLLQHWDYYNSLGFVARLHTNARKGRHIYAITAEMLKSINQYNDLKSESTQ